MECCTSPLVLNKHVFLCISLLFLSFVKEKCKHNVVYCINGDSCIVVQFNPLASTLMKFNSIFLYAPCKNHLVQIAVSY